MLFDAAREIGCDAGIQRVVGAAKNIKVVHVMQVDAPRELFVRTF